MLVKNREQYVILYLLRGSGSFVSKDGVEYELKPGSLVQRLPNMTHRIRRHQDGKWLEYAFVLSPTIYHAFVKLGVFSDTKIVFDLKLDMVILAKLISFTEMLYQANDTKMPMIMIKAQQFIYSFISSSGEKNHEGVVQKKIANACRILETNFKASLLMPTVAEQCGLGYHHFRKAFQMYVGSSPKDYHLRKKIDQAEQLIIENSLSFKEIAQILGYPDVITFSKQFKKFTGFTPGAFIVH